MLAEYRVAVNMRHGDLLLFDPHQWHGNTAMTCPHQPGALARACPEGCERVSLVAYYRTKVLACGDPDVEAAKAAAQAQCQACPHEMDLDSQACRECGVAG